MKDKVFILVLGICCIALVLGMYFMSKANTPESLVYIPVTWEGVAGFTSDNLYVPEYGESGMDIRENINNNLDRITIAIESLNERIEVLESKR
jgi:hypothetical protein